MTEKLKIGLWGCGNMGRSLARALAATGEAQLTIAYDMVPEAAAEMGSLYGAGAAAAPEALLDGLDGVIIALPPDLHAQAAITAAEAGVDTFVEKPMSVNTQGCRDMLAAARENGIKLMVGQVARYYEPYRAIRRWNAEGRFGELYAASIWRFFKKGRYGKDHWRADNARSGGYLLEVGAHELDMLRCLMGTPETISAVSRHVDPADKGWADFIGLQVRFANGGLADYEGGTGALEGHYGFRFYFEGATLVSYSAYNPQALHVHGAEIPPDAFSDENPIEAELRGWMAAIRDEGPVPIPGEEGMATVAFAESAYRAIKSGGPEPYTF